MPFNSNNIVAVLVYLERKNTRQFVGKLTRTRGKFCFTYDDQYLKGKDIIPLGPELPLTQKVHRSKNLFSAFTDRIPSKENPAYIEYCEATGIAPDEEDPFILLSTIGKRGPSSLVFEPEYSDDFTGIHLKQFRANLQLSIREFASVFQFSYAALNRTENDPKSGAEILKRAKIYAYYPQVAIDQLMHHGQSLHPNKKQHAINYLLQLKNNTK